MNGKFLQSTAIAVVVGLISAGNVSADLIVPGNVTDLFGNESGVADAGDASGLLFDEARTGAVDTAAATNFNPSRSLDGVAGTNDNWATGLSTGTAGTVTFTGLGLVLRGGTTASQIDLNIVYLGNNGNFGGGDDELVGTVSESLSFSSTAEYVWKFDTPLTFNFDGTETENNFRFELSTGGTGNLRFKSRPVNESPSGQGGLPLSVGGSFAPVAVPEPSSFAFLTMVACGYGLATANRRVVDRSSSIQH
ncbi:MAG: hypothetical protein AAGD11_04620 [Planctomycetota bacterium]